MSVTFRRFVLSKPRGFSPTDIDGLKLWLRADAGLYQDAAKTTPAIADGDVVGAWVDQSGQNNDATQATTSKKPLLKKAVVNGKPVVRFDGGDDVLQTAVFSPNWVQPLTFFVVYYAEVDARYIFDGLSDTSRIAHTSGITGSSNSFLYAGMTLGTTFPVFSWHIGSYVANQAASQVWDNGVSDASGSIGNYNLDGITVGSRYTKDNILQGDIADLLVYDSILSDIDRQRVENYLNGKYNVY